MGKKMDYVFLNTYILQDQILVYRWCKMYIILERRGRKALALQAPVEADL